MSGDVLVLGAGVAGIQASLVLAKAGRRVHLVEKSALIGGQVLKCEEVFPNMECATCMVSPLQQEVLQHDRIELLTLAELLEVKGAPGAYTARVRQQARYVDAAGCIGCGSCSEACPESTANDFEEGLAERKAISVPCPGALPNVPAVDPAICRRLQGDECNLCVEACMFGAVDFDQQDRELELEVGAILLATGFALGGADALERLGYGRLPQVYTAWELERLFASNGPTEGRIELRDGRTPRSAALVHCAGREEAGYCSAVCCLYSLKFARYLRSKIPDLEIHELHQGLCLPGRRAQGFAEKTVAGGLDQARVADLRIAADGDALELAWTSPDGESRRLRVDMAVLAPPVVPAEDTAQLAGLLGLSEGGSGFIAEPGSPSTNGGGGIFVAGGALGPMDVARAVTSADAAAGEILRGSAGTGGHHAG